jgi:diguanylate cyclase (GGDEF)-like protein
MDGMTAGSALIVAKICVAAIMIGIRYVLPGERCARYWATGAAFAAAGTLMLTVNGGAMRPAALIIGSSAIAFAMILHWMGLRVFYRKPPGYVGWMIGAMFMALCAVLVAARAPATDRAFLLAATVLAMLLLSAFEIQSGQRGRHTFASRLLLGTVLFLIACYLLNAILSGMKTYEFTPTTSSPVAVALLFLVPVAGTLLVATGQLLLLFERLIADKSYLATHDELTAILNRRAIVAGGEREVAIARRHGQPLTVAFVDIDFFKQINDRLGHHAGDQVLAEVATLIVKTCRNTDLVGRYGGEEFCIVLPGVGHQGAAIFGERLLHAVRQHRFHGNTKVTISIGLASGDGRSGGCTWNDLMARADAQLYKAKEAGRDRFLIASEARTAIAA